MLNITFILNNTKSSSVINTGCFFMKKIYVNKYMGRLFSYLNLVQVSIAVDCD
jgi:hypothetical protein